MTYGISVPSPQRTNFVSIRKTNHLIMFSEMKHNCRENRMEHINSLCGKSGELLSVAASGTYSYHRTLSG
jgi:hypothetical protein